MLRHRSYIISFCCFCRRYNFEWRRHCRGHEQAASTVSESTVHPTDLHWRHRYSSPTKNSTTKEACRLPRIREGTREVIHLLIVVTNAQFKQKCCSFSALLRPRAPPTQLLASTANKASGAASRLGIGRKARGIDATSRQRLQKSMDITDLWDSLRFNRIRGELLAC